MNIIKGLIFDLDGVLVDTKKIHFDALNKALKSVKAKEISFKDHLNIYDGLPTNKKLVILNKKKNLDIKLNSIVAKLKQKHTSNLLCKNIKFNSKIYNAFSKLSKNYKISLATNAVKKTLNTCIKKLKIKKFIFQSYSNEDVINNKPHPEVYLKCLVNMGLKPSENFCLASSVLLFLYAFGQR